MRVKSVCFLHIMWRYLIYRGKDLAATGCMNLCICLCEDTCESVHICVWVCVHICVCVCVLGWIEGGRRCVWKTFGVQSWSCRKAQVAAKENCGRKSLLIGHDACHLKLESSETEKPQQAGRQAGRQAGISPARY